jgi:hypothetical protein
MAKITFLEQQMKDGKPSGFKISLSDGTQGYLVEKDSDKGIKVGDEVTFTAVTPEGKTYKKVTVKLVQQGSAQSSALTPPQSQTLTPTGLKAEAVFKAMELANEDYRADKCTFEEVKAHFHTYLDALLSAIDECK